MSRRKGRHKAGEMLIDESVSDNTYAYTALEDDLFLPRDIY